MAGHLGEDARDAQALRSDALAALAQRGGENGLGGFGPTSEGMAIWIIGIVVCIAVCLWIGARA